jgi:hypothetical protein
VRGKLIAKGSRCYWKLDFRVILDEVKDLKSIKYEILRFAQNDIYGQNGGLQKLLWSGKLFAIRRAVSKNS